MTETQQHDPLVMALIGKMPPTGSHWPEDERRAWFVALEAATAVVYPKSPVRPAGKRQPISIEAIEDDPPDPAPDSGAWMWNNDERVNLLNLRGSGGWSFASIGKFLKIPAEECEREFERQRRIAGAVGVAKPSPFFEWIARHVAEEANDKPSPDISDTAQDDDITEVSTGSATVTPPAQADPEGDEIGVQVVGGSLPVTVTGRGGMPYTIVGRDEGRPGGDKTVEAVASLEEDGSMTVVSVEESEPDPEPEAPDPDSGGEDEPEAEADTPDFISEIDPEPEQRHKSRFQFNADAFQRVPDHGEKPKPVIDDSQARRFEVTDENIETLLRMRVLGHTYGEIGAITGGDVQELAGKFTAYSKQARWWYVINDAKEEAQHRRKGKGKKKPRRG